MPVTTPSRTSKAAEEMPASELQGLVKTAEAETKRTTAAEGLLPLKEKAADADDPETATDERGSVTPARPRKARRDASDAAAAAAAGRHISSLGDDILLEIFLRLPSLATLVRAAYTCRLWRRAVASSPAFRRRFRALHPPPLLGFFVNSQNVPSFPVFVPTRPRDLDLAAAVRGGDFFLTSLQGRPEEPICWEIIDCRGGNILLLNSADKMLALLNPLTRQRERILNPVPQGVYHDFVYNDVGSIFCSDEDPMSFLVAFLAFDESRSRIQAAVFASGTRVWSATPWVDFSAMPYGDNLPNEFCGSGVLHVVHPDRTCIISLDTATMELSMAKLPQCLIHSFAFGGPNDGANCIVYSDGSNVGVLMHIRDDDGVERWVEDRVTPMDTELKRVLSNQFDEEIELHVLEVWDGYAYLTTSAFNTSTQQQCWFLSLCLETMKLEKLFRRKFDRDVYLYFMPWPASLLGNCKIFAWEDTPLASGTCEEKETRI
ncbi:hypothetical protein QOZ80_5AG0365790 [Eleusine coracana subsp. coracana]|nr:hypothetical protein QOZ80_5AG0365790 [Eleusine coracana subsp. coracana]